MVSRLNGGASLVEVRGPEIELLVSCALAVGESLEELVGVSIDSLVQWSVARVGLGGARGLRRSGVSSIADAVDVDLAAVASAVCAIAGAVAVSGGTTASTVSRSRGRGGSDCSNSLDELVDFVIECSNLLLARALLITAAVIVVVVLLVEGRVGGLATTFASVVILRVVVVIIIVALPDRPLETIRRVS